MANDLQSDKYWKNEDGLDKRYHKFSGNYHNITEVEHSFTFKWSPTDRELDLIMATPKSTQTVSTYVSVHMFLFDDSYLYCTHLSPKFVCLLVSKAFIFQ